MSTENSGQSRKEQFLDLVINELMENGLSDMSLRDLAARLNTSHRILIYHFKSKEQLINLAVGEVRRRERDSFPLLTSTGLPGEERSLRDGLQAFFDHNISAGMRPYFRLLYEVWGRAQAQPDSWEQFLDGIVHGWVDALTGVFVQAGYGADVAQIRARLVLASLRGLQLDLYTTLEESRVRESFDALVDLIVAESESLVPRPATGGN